MLGFPGVKERFNVYFSALHWQIFQEQVNPEFGQFEVMTEHRD